MTGPGSRDSWSVSKQAAPTVTISSRNGSVPGIGSGARDPRNRRAASTDGVNASIVLILLLASTALALYDLYVLISGLVGG
jgi:hypothetical protein